MQQKRFPTTRLEAFSDGVLAVIITIMVLELKVPHEAGIPGLLSIAPMLFIYLLSFTFIAIYWVNHHQLIGRVEQCGHWALYANLAFLFASSLLPFFTAYVIENDMNSFSVALYAASMIVTGITFFLLRLAIQSLLKETGDLSQEDTATQRKHLASLVLYIAAIPLAHVHPRIALGVISLVTIIWIVPTAFAAPCPDKTPR
ncbi:TMEM175 family protein [Edaphobacter flagellatus]|uniref:TMEM175 family protein n=1 Tax=Edaphobacter flagellatus TaxID=1933044 RepID=UPI0021B4621F|nr:TMEM175 family protein [Edaphobacter flagellatus]